ncbi:MAG TPA: MBL fold metallo-hydrolase [Anaerolineales bacterium]|nr:MBL fold metallo-hydrolase [Anaerolineales bacterium]
MLHTIDHHFLNAPHFIASYLLEGKDGLVLIEAGPSSTLPTLLAGIRALGFDPAEVRNVLLTHIHLDHAGSAGWWAAQGAQIWVHPLGAPHLVEPERLMSSAGRIYGEHMHRLWGEMRPIPAEKITTLADGERFTIGGHTFTALDTPGHARHHLVYLLGDVAFTGDAAGERTLGEPFLTLPTPPPEFSLADWQATTDRLRQLSLSAIYLTHFGKTDFPQVHFEEQASLLQRCSEFMREQVLAGKSRAEAVQAYVDWNIGRASDPSLAQRGLMDYGTIFPYAMSTDGLLRYWQRQLHPKV